MMIVVAILALLMTIVFRLGGVGGGDNERAATLVRMQRIENCLSGYYAAFGSYPPVKVHGYRNIDQPVDENGDQVESGGEMGNTGEALDANRVNAACRSQPFGCEYPPCQSSDNGSNEEQIIKDWADEIKSRINNQSEYPYYAKWDFAEAFQGDIRGPSTDRGFSGEDVWNNPNWKVVKLFKFGVMSYLLPRYLFMMGGDQDFYSGGDGTGCAQWSSNNDIPSNPLTGKAYKNWDEVSDFAQTGKSDKNQTDIAKVANIPSQAVCARWMPNLEGICSAVGAKTFFGINIGGGGLSPEGWTDSDGEVHPPQNPGTHTRAGTTYKNASITVYDGWGREFYYYSPSPFQTYTLWSAGPNGKTFPPWMALDDLESKERKLAQEWKSDDIMQMSH